MIQYLSVVRGIDLQSNKVKGKLSLLNSTVGRSKAMRSAASTSEVLDSKDKVGNPEASEDNVERCAPSLVGVNEGENEAHSVEDKGDDGLKNFC